MSSIVPPEPASTIRELDVRPILAAGGSPLGAILNAVHALPAGASLRLIAPFEPVPLYSKLSDMGFTHTTAAREDGAWEILFSPQVPATPEPVWLDLRGLEPPEPMQRILEALADLAPGGTLVAHTRFRPVHLLSILDQRGIGWDSTEQPDGSWETIITQPPTT